MKEMKKYSGQAIAIIMVVLVVATVVGASLYSRVLTNRQTSFETTESRRALEEADSILDVFITSDLLSVQSALRECIEEDPNEPCEFTDIRTLADYFGERGVSTDILKTQANWCADSADDQNNMKVTISFADGNDFVEYQEGQVKAVNFGGVTVPLACNITFIFQALGVGNPLFTVKKVYMNGSGDVKPYERNDMLLHCLDTGANCEASPQDSINPTSWDNVKNRWYLRYPGIEVISGYDLYELRVLPLKYDLNVAMESEGCEDLLSDYKIVADVTCSGLGGAKQTIVPSEHNLGYPALFDYTLYNAEGALRPN